MSRVMFLFMSVGTSDISVSLCQVAVHSVQTPETRPQSLQGTHIFAVTGV